MGPLPLHRRLPLLRSAEERDFRRDRTGSPGVVDNAGRVPGPIPYPITAAQINTRRYGRLPALMLAPLTLSVCSLRIWSKFPDATSQIRAVPTW